LQQGLSDDKEAYGDSLIDQSLDNIEAANEAAAAQRER
jgi:hypothetical protein